MEINEPKSSWGGKWTEQKLDAFSKYVWSYLTIMKNHPYWETIYFDGFAGSGDRGKDAEMMLQQKLNISPEEEDVYKGAAERVLNVKNNLFFDYYYFVERDEQALNTLKDKFSGYNDIPGKIEYRAGNANSELRKMAEAMKSNPNKYAALVFLDPFGMQISWDSIFSLKGTKTDTWILVPTGVIINRLLDKQGELKNYRKLESFFGLNKDEIKKYFYRETKQPSLFGDEQETLTKVMNPIKKISELYVDRLETVWDHVTKTPLVLKNRSGVPIFHFVFGSNNQNATRIAGEIIQKR